MSAPFKRATSGDDERLELLGGPCPDPLDCRHKMRFASGPWTCAYCHPREPAPSIAGDARPEHRDAHHAAHPAPNPHRAQQARSEAAAASVARDADRAKPPHRSTTPPESPRRHDPPATQDTAASRRTHENNGLEPDTAQLNATPASPDESNSNREGDRAARFAGTYANGAVEPNSALAAAVHAHLHACGATSARTLARDLRRRQADVREALYTLEAQGRAVHTEAGWQAGVIRAAVHPPARSEP